MTWIAWRARSGLVLAGFAFGYFMLFVYSGFSAVYWVFVPGFCQLLVFF